MNKKTIIILGISTIFLSLFLNFMFSNNTENVDITLANVEALATSSETSDGLEITCINTGSICIGVDANGHVGHHPGLNVKP